MSDITPEERRKVAEKLRQYVNGFDFGDANPVWYVMKSVFGDVHKREYSELFTRLANLIDPTCELKIQDGHACCGNCGHILAGEYESEEDYWCFRPYCPDCGARVVRDDD